MSFTARFGGVSYPVHVPLSAVLAVYARETGQGMALPEEPLTEPEPEGERAAPAVERWRTAFRRQAAASAHRQMMAEIRSGMYR